MTRLIDTEKEEMAATVSNDLECMFWSKRLKQHSQTCQQQFPGRVSGLKLNLTPYLYLFFHFHLYLPNMTFSLDIGYSMEICTEKVFFM